MKVFNNGKKSLLQKFVIFFFCVIFFLSGFGIQEAYCGADEGEGSTKHVLYIGSYSDGFLNASSELLELREFVEGIPAELDAEFLESDRFERETNERSFFERLKFKIDNSYRYDAVVLSGDEALYFVQQYYGQLFGDTPIFFYNVNNSEKVNSAEKNPYFQGIHNAYSVYQNITIAAGLNRNLRRIVAVTDDTMYGFSIREEFERLQEEFPNIRFSLINAGNYTTAEIAANLSKLSADDSAVFYFGMHKSREGYEDIEQFKTIAEKSGAPVYTISESLVGFGAIGGYVVSTHDTVKRIVEAIKIYLENYQIAEVKIDKDVSSYYYFDKEVLDKYKYDLSALPSDVVFTNGFNYVGTVQYPVIIVTVVIFAALFLGVFRLVFMLKKHERMTKELSISRDSLLSSEQKMKSQFERLEYVVSHDSTTGLINRQEFVDKISGELVTHDSCAFFIIDIDDFKKINDSMGHHYGDEIIKMIADRIERMSSMDAVVGRFGGDEFIIAIMDVTEEEIESYIEKLRNALKQKFIVNGKNIYLNFSTGIALYPKDGNMISDLVVNADLALSRVKISGKDSYAFFDEEMKREARRKEEIENTLRRAINENGFEVYFQPKIDLRYGRVAGFEALIRLKDKSVGPSVFIPIAEETGLIITIDRWVTSEVIKRLSQWKIMGLDRIPVSVNYSAKQMRDKEYPSYVRELLEKENVEPDLLDIEITEGIFIDDNASSKGVVEELRQVGVTLSMDDFGTGYSSLNYLNYIDVDYVKLDKSMIDRYLEHDDEVLACTIALIHSLGLKVVAEGIDSWGNCDRIRECGCDYIQGNLFGKAMPIDEATKIHDKSVNFEHDVIR